MATGLLLSRRRERRHRHDGADRGGAGADRPEGVPWPSVRKAGNSKSVFRSPCSVALDAGGVISAMRPYRDMQPRRVAERCLRGHRTRKSAAIVGSDGEGRVLGCGRGGLRDRVPCRGRRRKERGKNERRAQRLEAGHPILLPLARNPCACRPLTRLTVRRWHSPRAGVAQSRFGDRRVMSHRTKTAAAFRDQGPPALRAIDEAQLRRRHRAATSGGDICRQHRS